MQFKVVKDVGYTSSLRFFLLLAFFAIILSPVQTVVAQASLPLYTDNLVNGFQDWSFNSTRNFSSPTNHTDSYSISVIMTSGGGALSLQYPNGFDTSLYTNLVFWINGGVSGGQQLKVYGTIGNVTRSVQSLTKLETNIWQQFTIPLTALGIANKTNCSGIWIQSSTGGSQPVFYVDDIQLTAVSAPVIIHLGVDAFQKLRAVDARQFGVNTATWDGVLGNSQTLSALQEAGCMALRWPGGSTSDAYHWANDPAGNSTFMNVVTGLNAQTNSFITVNYGSGTSNEAAAWVLSENVINNCGIKYWEIGNECYGSWETDSNNLPHDPYTYATRAAGYIQLMKAADPAIKIGVVAVTGEDSYSNNATHFEVNPRTGTHHYGWTPVMLATLKNLGVTPDFLIDHYYPQYTAANSTPPSTDSDPLLLQAAANWANDSANLRQQITDYFGPTGTNIELCVTENNSDSGAMGRQSTSIVNALYLADSTSQLMKTEFNSYLWWDLHNSADTSGDFDPKLYGWRDNGDYGILSTANVRYPTFYAEKLLQFFARPGDSVLAASSDYLALSAYAVRKADGALAMLVINKTPTNIFDAQIALTNFVPWSTATARSYGLQQDEATRTNAVASAQDIFTNAISSAAVFTNSFPPYSLTLLTFAPAASQLSVISSSQAQITFQIQGQSGVPYSIQSCTNLANPNWVSVTNIFLMGNTLTLTNAISADAPAQFWRAVWTQ